MVNKIKRKCLTTSHKTIKSLISLFAEKHVQNRESLGGVLKIETRTDEGEDNRTQSTNVGVQIHI